MSGERHLKIVFLMASHEWKVTALYAFEREPSVTGRAIERNAGLRRRRVLAALPMLALGSGSLAQSNQSSPKRVGVLYQGTRVNDPESLETAFVESMKARHWVLGRDSVDTATGVEPSPGLANEIGLAGYA